MLISALPSALAHFEALAARLAGRRPAVFLDYDGTLAPIAAQPDQAVLPEATRPVLRRLARACPVALVSGRDVATLRRLVGLEGVTFAGEHGFDIRRPDGSAAQPPELADLVPEIDEAAAALQDEIGALAGVLLERKRFSVAAHYRNAAPEAVEAVRAAVERQRGRHPRITVMHGKKVLELQPALDWNKGRAVLALIEEQGVGPESLPIFIGDDVTDESAFEVLGERGVSIVLEGEEDRETAATLRLADPAEVRRFLERLLERLDGRGG